MMDNYLINKIKNNNIFTIFNSDDYQKQDELGFDILHYAILFGDDNAVDKVLKKRNLLPEPIISDVFMFVYDYSYIASLLHRESIVNKLSDSSPYVRDSLHCLEVMERVHKTFENTIKTERYTIRKLRDVSKQAQPIKKKQIDIKIRQLTSSIEIQQRFVNSIESDIEEAQETVEKCKLLYKKDFELFRKGLLDAPELVKILLYIIGNYKEFKNSNATIELNYNNAKIRVSEEIYNKFQAIENNKASNNKTDKANYTNKEQQNDNRWKNNSDYKSNNYSERKKDKSYNSNEKFDVKKPFGNHWFSDEAWKNIDILRREYRVLAKEYHPDNHPEKIKIFMSIQSERSIILDNLKYK